MKLKSIRSNQVYSFEEIEAFSKQINGTIHFGECDMEGLQKISLQWGEYDGCHQKEDREEIYIVIKEKGESRGNSRSQRSSVEGL